MCTITQPKKVAFDIVQTLQNSGHIAYFAGGAVRDELLGREPKDYDVATSALPEQIEALFTKTLSIGKAFGVIGVVADKVTVEVATFRSEQGTLDGRHPTTVVFSSEKEDALRRDFTVNGMFYDPIADQLYDYVNGQRDLERGIIAAIGNPIERFQEDHLRLLRAIRFTHTLGFALDPETEAAVREIAHLITGVSAERIEQELSRTLTESRKPGDALRCLYETGLLKHILPELIPMVGQEQPPQFHPEGDVFEHTVLMLNLMNEQARMPAPHEKTGPKQVGQASQPAHPEDELAENLFRPVEPSETLHTHHRRLPHWQQDSRVYFITFRLADSIAQQRLNQWKEQLETWRLNQPDPNSTKTLSEQTQRYREKQEEWLDQGHGSCILKDPALSHIVESTLLHFDGERYRLGRYVIMPNHVHVIVEPIEGFSLSEILHTWKGYSAQQINKLRGKQGALWQDESFDHIIRREFFLHKYDTYIQNGPEQANLQYDSYCLGTGVLSICADEEQARMPAPHAPHKGQASLPAHSERKRSYTPRELAYTTLLHDVGKPPTACMGTGTDGKPRIRFDGHAATGSAMADEILTRLRLPNKERKHIVEAIHGHMRFMEVQKMRTAKLRRFIGKETFDLEMELHRLDCLGSHAMLDNYDYVRDTMEEMANEPVLPEPWLRGHDLISMGFTEGKLLGKILKEAYDAQMENRFSDREELFAWIKSNYANELKL